MSTKDIDDLAWRIMLENAEYDELDRIFAINGILYTNHYNKLSKEEQDDIIKRLGIGIQAFNAEVKQRIEDHHSWRKLPDIKVSGNEEN